MTPLWKALAPWSVAPGTTAGHLTFIRIFVGFLWSQQFCSHRPPGDAPFFPAQRSVWERHLFGILGLGLGLLLWQVWRALLTLFIDFR